MLEQLLINIKPPVPIVRSDVFFIDMAQSAETIKGYSFARSGGAVVDTVNLINGLPTLSLPTAGGSGSRGLMTLSPALTLQYGWTIEWSEYYTGQPVNWTNEIYLSDSTLYKGITIRWGDNGYGGLLMFSDNNNSGTPKSECRFNVTPSQVVGKEVHWAMTCDSTGKIRLYMDGNIVLAANGASGSAFQSYFQGGPVSNYASLTTMYIGALNANANNVARRMGNIRLSTPALYTGSSYTRVPF